MDKTIICGPRSGSVRVPSSKSHIHRLLILAALGGGPVDIFCDGMSDDVKAAARCAAALGSPVVFAPWGIRVGRRDGSAGTQSPVLLCGESGMTLRCMLAAAGALLSRPEPGGPVTLRRSGSLTGRTVSPLDGVLRSHGMDIREDGADIVCSGGLRPGYYRLPGNVSSQFVSALLMALPMLRGDSVLEVEGRLGSAPYAFMTEDALRLAGVRLEREGTAETGLVYRIPGGQVPRLPKEVRAEGDWSAAAVFLCAGAFSEKGIEVTGIDPSSGQGDSSIIDILMRFGAAVSLTVDGVLSRKGRGRLRGAKLDASYIPDLVPPVCALAAAAEGTSVISGASRLRLKESDRLNSCAGLLKAVGADAEACEDGLTVTGTGALSGAPVSSFGDHRIAMAAAACSCACEGVMTVLGAECVSKSYPRFWEDWDSLSPDAEEQRPE